MTERALAALRAALAAHEPRLAAIAASVEIATQALPQDFFARHQIVHVEVRKKFPPYTCVAALGPDDAVHILSGDLEALNAIARAEPPHGLGDLAAARRYAVEADGWTTPYRHGQLEIASFDDLPWWPVLTPEWHAQIARLRHDVGRRIGPEEVVREGDAVVVRGWVVAESHLVRRELRVAPDGRLERHLDVVAEGIPVPPGKAWSEDARGRWVPVQ